MISLRLSPIDTEFVDTPRGIAIPSGLWFSVREKDLRAWAGRVLDEAGLNSILGEVALWHRVPSIIVLWIAPPVLMLLNPLVVLPILLLAVPILQVLMPALIAGPLVAAARYLDLVLLQALYYIVFLSIVSQSGSVSTVVAALVLFVIVRLGILDRLFGWMSSHAIRRVFGLPGLDVALRSRIITLAAMYGISLEGHEDFGAGLKGFSWRS